ncbi:MAG: hypothetical protein AAF639_40175 [Chloroflexota bacterium]
MLLRPEMQQSGWFNLLFEFKQLSLKKIVEASEEVESANKKKSKNKEPLSGAEVKGKSRDELLAIPAVRAEITQAKSQLGHYQQVLYEKYGTALKLRSFAVVGIGVGRVVWEIY